MMTTDLDADLAALAERVRTSTVAVRQRRGGGSGIVWSPELVLTNAHVAVRERAEIVLPDERRIHGRVIARDEQRDLAAIAVDEPLVPIDVRDDAVRPGELLFSFGHPLGVSNALSAGIALAATRRYVSADLRLAPGNSGGPLVDARGALVGVNSLIAGGAAYAVPVAAVRAFLDERGSRRAA